MLKVSAYINKATTNKPPIVSNKRSLENPRSPEGYYNLAASLHKTGTLYNRPSDLQQAENLYNQCLERDPNHTECYRGLAVLLNETGRQKEAFNLLNHWASANPKSADPKVELARLLEESGQPDQAKAQLVDALNHRSPQRPGSHRARPTPRPARRPRASASQLPEVAPRKSVPTRSGSPRRAVARRGWCTRFRCPGKHCRNANRYRCGTADAVLSDSSVAARATTPPHQTSPR